MNTNAEWQEAAVNNLISQGVPPDQASTAIQAHLNAQPLSPAMAASRDLAIDSIGPPPQVPAPAQRHAPLTAGAIYGHSRDQDTPGPLGKEFETRTGIRPPVHARQQHVPLTPGAIHARPDH